MANGLLPKARTYWLQGRDDDLRTVYAQMCELESMDESPEAKVLRLEVAGFLQLSDGLYGTAVESLAQAEQLAEESPLSFVYVYPQIVRSYALWRMGDVDSALTLFAPLLAECEEARTKGVVLHIPLVP